MAVTEKMTVDVTGFKKGIAEANTSVKTLDAELKRNEAQFKATGDAEQYLTDKARLLQMQMSAQKNEITIIENALKAMRDSGVKPTDQAYQKMLTSLANAQTKMLNMSTDLQSTTTDLQNMNTEVQNVAASEETAGTNAKDLNDNLEKIGQKMSLDQVIGGIDKITGALERAAKKAAEVGRSIWDNIMDSAALADDTATAAMLLDMNVVDYQKYKGVFDTIGELTVADWMAAKRKVQKAINDASDDQLDVLKALGISTEENGAARGWEDVFWDVAKGLKDAVDSGTISQDLADTWGEAFFGKKFSSLKPLIEMGQEGFTEALEKQAAADEDAIKKNAELNDSYVKLKNSVDALKMELTSGLAPALTGAVTAIDGLLTRILEYLKTEEGQQALKDMGTAVSGLFNDLSKIDPAKVVEGFAGVFDQIVKGLQWLTDNSGAVIAALSAIVAGWAGLKLTGGALQILKLVQGLQGLKNGNITLPGTSGGGNAGTSAGGGDAGTGAGATGGLAASGGKLAAAGGLTATALMMAAPALVGILASKIVPESAKLGSEARVEGASYTQAEIDRLREWANIQNQLMEESAKFGTADFDESRFNALSDALDALKGVQQGDLWNKYWDYLVANNLMPGENTLPTDLLDQMSEALKAAGAVEVPTEGVLTDGTAEELQKQMDKVSLTVTVTPELAGIGSGGIFGILGGAFGKKKANGIWSVPWDGYPAILHRGERVLTATENRSYTANSNLYVENMNMHNGLDAEALVRMMNAQTQRVRAGFGS